MRHRACWHGACFALIVDCRLLWACDAFLSRQEADVTTVATGQVRCAERIQLGLVVRSLTWPSAGCGWWWQSDQRQRFEHDSADRQTPCREWQPVPPAPHPATTVTAAHEWFQGSASVMLSWRETVSRSPDSLDPSRLLGVVLNGTPQAQHGDVNGAIISLAVVVITGKRQQLFT